MGVNQGGLEGDHSASAAPAGLRADALLPAARTDQGAEGAGGDGGEGPVGPGAGSGGSVPRQETTKRGIAKCMTAYGAGGGKYKARSPKGGAQFALHPTSRDWLVGGGLLKRGEWKPYPRCGSSRAQYNSDDAQKQKTPRIARILQSAGCLFLVLLFVPILGWLLAIPPAIGATLAGDEYKCNDCGLQWNSRDLPQNQ